MTLNGRLEKPTLLAAIGSAEKCQQATECHHCARAIAWPHQRPGLTGRYPRRRLGRVRCEVENDLPRPGRDPEAAGFRRAVSPDRVVRLPQHGGGPAQLPRQARPARRRTCHPSERRAHSLPTAQPGPADFSHGTVLYGVRRGGGELVLTANYIYLNLEDKLCSSH